MFRSKEVTAGVTGVNHAADDETRRGQVFFVVVVSEFFLLLRLLNVGRRRKYSLWLFLVVTLGPLP